MVGVITKLSFWNQFEITNIHALDHSCAIIRRYEMLVFYWPYICSWKYYNHYIIQTMGIVLYIKSRLLLPTKPNFNSSQNVSIKVFIFVLYSTRKLNEITRIFSNNKILNYHSFSCIYLERSKVQRTIQLMNVRSTSRSNDLTVVVLSLHMKWKIRNVANQIWRCEM